VLAPPCSVRRMFHGNWRWAGFIITLAAVDCRCGQRDTCVGDADCSGAGVCRDEVCVVPTSACIVDDECPEDQACRDGFCGVGARTTDGSDASVMLDAGLECEFGQRTCLDSTTLITCEFGHYASVDCSRNSYACVDSACVPPPCTPDGGANRCVDVMTLQNCADPDELTDCAQDEACWQGRCATATGEPCTSDNECAGGYCHCKPGACTGALAGGYCSGFNCNVPDGGACPAGDVCMGLSSAGGGQANLCGRKADTTCPESNSGQGLDYVGPYQRHFPVPDISNAERYSFGDAVCFDVRPFPTGAACAGAGECIGGSAVGFSGQCETFGGAVTSGYCTHACDGTHPCAPGEACAHRTEDPANAGICVLACSSQRPGLVTCSRSGVTCRQPDTAWTILDGQSDAEGFCLP
jgi:hypothetical protein